jgi:hypothetical protein
LKHNDFFAQRRSYAIPRISTKTEKTHFKKNAQKCSQRLQPAAWRMAHRYGADAQLVQTNAQKQVGGNI